MDHWKEPKINFILFVENDRFSICFIFYIRFCVNSWIIRFGCFGILFLEYFSKWIQWIACDSIFFYRGNILRSHLHVCMCCCGVYDDIKSIFGCPKGFSTQFLFSSFNFLFSLLVFFYFFITEMWSDIVPLFLYIWNRFFLFV